MRRAERQGDAGSATVLMITLCFVFLTGALVWLSRTVDQSLHDRTNASAIAFQAARAGAQVVDPSSTRTGTGFIDPIAARLAVEATTSKLLKDNGDTGSVTAFTVSGNRVNVSVTITTTGRPATGSASATASPGVNGPLP